MKLAELIFGSIAPDCPPDHENNEAVIIHFYYGQEELDPLYDLESKLDKIITESRVGKFDWHEMNMDNTDGYLFMYGPDANKLFKAAIPVLDACDFMRGAIARLRFGVPGTDSPEIEINL